MEKQLNELKEDKQKLHEQLETKDKQIETLADALNTSQRLVENSQVLQKQQQDKIFLLEAPQDKPVKEKSLFKMWFNR